MSLTLSVEVDSPAAVSMVLDNMDGASDPDATLDDNALVRLLHFVILLHFVAFLRSLSFLFFLRFVSNFFNSTSIFTECTIPTLREF